MKHANRIVMVLAGAVLLTAGALKAEAAVDTNLQAAVENVEKVADLMAGKTAAEASALAAKLMETAIAMGGTELELRDRIAKLVAACIATSGANAPAVAAALVKAGGAERTGVVVAAIAVAAGTAGLNVADVTKAAIDAAAEADKAVAQAAVADPQKYLGRMGVWIVQNTARRFVPAGAEKTGTTTTTTTTTTLPSATPAAAGM